MNANAAMNAEIMRSTVPIVPTAHASMYDMPGYTKHDPFHNYKHVCDKCSMVQIKQNHENPLQLQLQLADTDTNSPQAYNGGSDYLDTNKHVCFPKTHARQCRLTPLK